MICHRCLRAAARVQLFHPSHNTTAPSFNRLLSTTSQQGSLPSLHKLPAATSTSAAQPLSTPLTPSPAAVGVEPGKSQIPVIILSSTPAGTPLKGLNFLKSRSDPIALEDSEYPSWLWDILKKDGKKGEDGKEGDLFSKSKKQRRLAAKRLRKQALINPEMLTPKVPIYEQSIDLPTGDGTVQGAVDAVKAREDLRKAMRVKRRTTIKEGNFLKSMA
ncbi:mitochondrial 54S ribosomal protein mL54 [Cenococcum geophilum 1.58]|uniref:mitochondrial 54S ribosomal protein mL54 n=1 Tax=Cenococcum geophilum 1.58 TaxID=794803 RepID=UPI00358F9F78|nr:hypothetical protein K441DRAFT_656537 [Cenococcum geophilum 1.58]